MLLLQTERDLSLSSTTALVIRAPTSQQHLETSSPPRPINTFAMDETAGSTTYPQAMNSNAAAVTHGETSSEPVQAYAKLEGDSFCYYIRTLQVTFGRKASSSDHVDIHLGPTKAISRQHARLFYNFTTQRFEMMVFGKNGAFVNDQFVEKGVTVPLENRTKIQIGEVSFSFLLPKIETDENSSADAAHAQGSSQRNNGIASGNHHGGSSSALGLGMKREGSSQAMEQFDSSEYSSKDTKPPFSYASLIAQAINSTPERKLTLNGIYQHITQHYPYYQMAQNGWQNSIRHNLSLNKAFVKVPRSDSEPGKGAFWTIDQSCEAQFSNGVYKRSRRAMSSRPGGGRSESPMDLGDKPRKRPNTGIESTLNLSQPIASSSQQATTQLTAQGTTSQPQTTQPHSTPGQLQQPDYSQISEASLKLAALLQQNPGVLALNLATLTQSLSAANKEGAQSAILNALLAAAKANSANAQAGAAAAGGARSPATAGSPSGGLSPAVAPSITPQSLATLQAVAAALAAARGTTAAVTAATAAAAAAAASPVLGNGPTPTAGATSLAATPNPAGTGSSPIAQLVAAAQAQQAQARAFALAQAQGQVPAQTAGPTAGSASPGTDGQTTPASSAITSATDPQAQILALQARALTLAQERQAQEVTEAVIFNTETIATPVAAAAVAGVTMTSSSSAAGSPTPSLAMDESIEGAAEAAHTPDTSVSADKDNTSSLSPALHAEDA